ncbi:MAG: glycosyltransferase family 2 protein [Notoacmeibacter sp.]|nr:glycosyltransferase family 2 protein [Notoacmeibacter sp.]
MQDYIVSLTTIPSRHGAIEATLQSLRAQTVPPREIAIYVPKSYRRAEFRDAPMPRVPSWCRVVQVDEDLGPATKVLYAIGNAGALPVLYCDDDRLYPPDMADTYLAMAAARPGACVAGRAVPVRKYLMQYGFEKDAAYRLRRILSFGRYRPKEIRPSDRLDIAAGFAGVLVQPGAFDDRVFDIPEHFWLVDDIWLSGHMALAGTAIVSPGRNLARSGRNEANEADALNAYVYQDRRREELDRMCIRHFQAEHGLWSEARA